MISKGKYTSKGRNEYDAQTLIVSGRLGISETNCSQFLLSFLVSRSWETQAIHIDQEVTLTQIVGVSHTNLKHPRSEHKAKTRKPAKNCNTDALDDTGQQHSKICQLYLAQCGTD